MSSHNGSTDVHDLEETVRIGDVIKNITYENAVLLLRLLRQKNRNITFSWYKGTNTHVTVSVMEDE